jgi:hypothetical protein
MRLSRPRFTLGWMMMVVAVLAVAFAVIGWFGPRMWIVWPAFFTLSWLAPGPIAAVWGFVVIVRRKTRLTRRRVITGKPAIALGSLAIVAGLAYAPLLIYWAIVNYPTGW